MTVKRLSFSEKGEDRAHFEQLWDAVLLGSQQGQPTGKPKKQIREEAALQRKLIAVSDVATSVDRSLRPNGARTLKPGVQTVDLTAEQVTLATELAEKVPWGGGQVIAVADMYDMLEFAPTVTDPDEGTKPVTSPVN